jgi:cysteinyl-tRNA synthetase
MSSLRLRNTYSKELETFEPLDPDRGLVTMYCCGPTVYSFAHIGNFRSFLFADVLRRVLERRGLTVRQVMNVTDVGHMTQDHLADATGEDKLAKAARELGKDPFAVAAHFERAFVEDAIRMRLRNFRDDERDDRALHPQATRHIPEMLDLIQSLIERDFAYPSTDGRGEVYFDISKFPEYGRLSGKPIDELEPGARVAVREGKRDPRDFALWKADEKHLMQWDPHGEQGWDPEDLARYRALRPEGVDRRIAAGFPGWHIECSAMARAHLGDRIDIHTGGEDNVFPHHECEIAQSYGATGVTTEAPGGAKDGDAERKTFARYWVHGRHLLVGNRKMSKRDGTFYTVRDLLDPRASEREDLATQLEAIGFAGGRVPPSVLRYALISNHYGQPMNFGLDLLEQARASLGRLQARYDRLREVAVPGQPSEGIVALTTRVEESFDRALDEDLNMPKALAAVFGLVSELNQLEPTGADAAEALASLERIDAVLDVLDREVRSGLMPKAAIESLAAQLGAAGDEPLVSGRSQADVEAAIAHRHAAKKARDFARADAIRSALKSLGITIDDTPEGVRWKHEGEPPRSAS